MRSLGTRGAGLVTLAVVALAILVACPIASAAPVLPAGFEDEPVATLAAPTDLAFAPDGRLLVATEPGQLRIVKDGALLPAAALDISPKVCSDGERGLMAVTTDPLFASNRFVYLYYTFKKHGVCPVAPSSQLPVNRVSRFVLGGDDHVDPASEVVLIDNIPAPQTYHIGADLQFGKDGFLYASTGDGGCNYLDSDYCDRWNPASRDQNVLLGKVLRITRQGGIPAANPYQGADSARCNLTGITDPGKKCQETYAWGLRNPFRLALDPNKWATRFFINDVGEVTWEEIDLGQSGADYGWNVREGFCATGSTTDCGAPPAGMTNPIHVYNHDSGCMAITGGAFVPNGVWSQEYDGAYLFADLTCGKIFALRPASGGGWTQTEFGSGFGDYSLITMTFGPPSTQQFLYYVTWNGPGQQVRRMRLPAPNPYPRPGGATPLRVPLVPAFARCAAPNSAHVAPLAEPSCAPPALESPLVTTSASGVGSGYARLTVIVGDPSTGIDEADVGVFAHVADVRRATDGSDYAGRLLLRSTLRITDRGNGAAGTEAGTVQDAQIGIPLDCVATGAGAGSDCAVATTLDTLAPGTAREGKRAVISTFTIDVADPGPDGSLTPVTGCPPRCGTGDEARFVRQGVFTP